MRPSWKSSTIAALAVALVLALPAPTQANSGATAGDAGRAHREAKAALEAVSDALNHGQRSDGPRTDLSLLLRDLRFAMPNLSGAERTTAGSYLARPGASGCSGNVKISGHFCVHYETGLLAGADAATPDQAQLTADTLTNVWNYEVGRLGFRSPPSDGDAYYDVYLQDIGSQGYYGYCSPDDNTPHSSSFCVLDNDFSSSQFGGAAPLNSLRVTAAHEFFHAIQYGYDTTEDIWLMEGSAVWAEDQVYPTINDYRQYLPFSAIPHPRTPIDYIGTTSSDLFYRYGAVLFWKFLSEQFRDPGIIRRVWEYADGNRYSLQAVAGALAERGWSFANAFARFGVWNTLPRGTYGDRAIFPSPAWWQVTKLSRRHRDTGVHTVGLNHLTNAASYFRPAPKLPRRTKLRIRFYGPTLVHQPRATVQLRHPDGTYRLIGIPLNSSGDGTVLVRFNPRKIAAVVVTVTNASPRMTCGVDRADRFSCAGMSLDDGQSFSVRAKVKLP